MAIIKRTNKRFFKQRNVFQKPFSKLIRSASHQIHSMQKHQSQIPAHCRIRIARILAELLRVFWASRKKGQTVCCAAEYFIRLPSSALNKMKCVGRKKFGCDLGGGLRMGQWGRNCPTIYGFWADDDAHSTTQTPAAAD